MTFSRAKAKYEIVAEDKTQRALRQIKNNLSSIDQGFGLIKGAAVGMGAAFAGAFALREIAQFSRAIADAGDKLELMRQRAENLTGSSSAFDLILQSADKLGIAIDDVSSTFGRFALAGKDIGLATDEVVRLNEVVLQLGRLSGASSQELSAGAMQLSQALASGRLQGDELRSVLENMPMLARTLAEQLGVGVGQLRQMGSEGVLTAEVVSGALLEAAEDVSAEFANLPEVLAQSEARLSNEWTQLLGTLDDVLMASEAWEFFTKKLAEGAKAARIAMGGETESEARGVIEEALDRQLEKVSELERKVRDTRDAMAEDPRPGDDKMLGYLEGLLKAEQGTLDVLNERVTIQESAGRLRSGEVDRAAVLLQIEGKITEELGEQNTRLRSRPQRRPVIPVIPQTSEADLRRMWKTDTRDTNPFTQVDSSIEALDDKFDGVAASGEQAAQSIGNAFASNLSGVISGWSTFEDLLKNIANSISSIVIRTAIQAGVNSLFSGAGGGGESFAGGFSGSTRATGGPVTGGSTYLVGERGPELFVPQSSGYIDPNPGGGGGSGGGVVINNMGPPVSVSNERRLPDGRTELTIRQASAAAQADIVRQLQSGYGPVLDALQSSTNMRLMPR